MRWTADDIPDQSGRVAVVTGGNGGLGLETARQLARHGALVVMAARSPEKAAIAEADIRQDVPRADLEVRRLDLASLASVEGFARALLADHDRIDLMINNAGVMGTPRMETVDGFELQFGTNHLGHFALNARLMPAILRAPGARVVTVTSTGRLYGGKLDPSDPHLRHGYQPWRAYGQSKMANVHYALELDRRLRQVAAPVASLVAHPGFARTELQATSARLSPGGRSQRFFHRAVQRFGMPASDGALPTLRAATDPEARGGEMYTPRWVSFGPPVRRPLTRRSRNPGAMARLWEISQQETGIEYDVAAMVDDLRN